jgi:ribonuclease H2 subunit B
MLEEAALVLQEQSQSRKDGRISNEDILRFTSLRCARNALKHICDIKSQWRMPGNDCSSHHFTAITEEITVYRYSRERALDYLRKKVVHLSTPSTLEKSKTIIRSLAKDGLMEDGNEELLNSGFIHCTFRSLFNGP